MHYIGRMTVDELKLYIGGVVHTQDESGVITAINDYGRSFYARRPAVTIRFTQEDDAIPPSAVICFADEATISNGTLVLEPYHGGPSITLTPRS